MRYLTLTFSFFAIVLLTSCEDEPKTQEDLAPTITVVKPVANVQLGQKIPITLEFKDDHALQSVEISLGSNEHSSTAYHYVTRGLSGREDQISYMVEPPAGVNILGSNYIFVTCLDDAGQTTTADEDFNVVDGSAPSATFFYMDTVSTMGMDIEVIYQAEDNDGLAKVVLELWQVDANGNKTQKLDFKADQFTGETTVQEQHFFERKSSYPIGGYYQFYLTAYDASGNFVDIGSPSVGVFQ